MSGLYDGPLAGAEHDLAHENTDRAIAELLGMVVRLEARVDRLVDALEQIPFHKHTEGA